MPRAKTPRTTTPPNKQVLTMPEVTSVSPVRKASPSGNSTMPTLKPKSVCAPTNFTRSGDTLPARKTRTGCVPNAK